MSGLSGRAALVGIGQTEFSKESGRSELQLACEAVSAALDDAGLTPADVDGLVTFTLDNNEEMEVARSVGIQDLTMFSRISYGGGAAAAHRDAGRDGRGHRRRRGGRLLPRDERTVGAAVRQLRRGDDRAAAVALDVRAVRVDDAGVVGRAAGAARTCTATA